MPTGRTAPVPENGKAVQAVGAAEPQRGENDSQTSFPMPILPDTPADVKMLLEFQERHIPAMDVVETVRTIYPGFDNPLLSKCRNYRQYGIALKRDAVKLLAEHFAVAPTEAPRKPQRKKPKRITCRLTDAMYSRLQRELDRTGITLQSFLENLIARALPGGDGGENL